MQTDGLSVFLCCAARRNPLAQMEEERREHETKMKKMEQEMEQVFEMKVKEKTQKLKDSEADVSGQLAAVGCNFS
jgi:septin family protein